MDETTKYTAISWEMAAVIHAQVKGGIRKLDKGLDLALRHQEKERALANRLVPFAKKGSFIAIDWLENHFFLKVFTPKEILVFQKGKTPPDPEEKPKPYSTDFNLDGGW